jgi:hypothetical protein
MKKYLRELPAINLIQKDLRFNTLAREKGIPILKLTEWTQYEINSIRESIVEGTWQDDIQSRGDFETYIFSKLEEKADVFHKHQLRRVIKLFYIQI